MATKPIAGIQPFTGKAAAWFAKYLRTTTVDPEAQRAVNERIRANASRVAKGTRD